MFDPNALMQSAYSGKLDTVRPALREDDYTAIIDDVTMRTAKTEDGEQPILRVTWKIIDDAKLAQQDRDAAKVNQDLFLEVDQNGGLDQGKGKNVGLGRLLEALKLNGGQWSFGQLKGMGPCLLRIAPRADKKNPDIQYDEVRRVVGVS